MKNRYYILAGIVYTLFVGFIVNAVTYRVTYEEVKESCLIDGCINVYEYTGEVGGEEWEELITITEEQKCGRQMPPPNGKVTRTHTITQHLNNLMPQYMSICL